MEDSDQILSEQSSVPSIKVISSSSVEETNSVEVFFLRQCYIIVWLTHFELKNTMYVCLVISYTNKHYCFVGFTNIFSQQIYPFYG